MGLTESELIAIRRELHRCPELSGEEYRTMETVCGYLAKWGIEFEKGVAETGVVAWISGAKPGRTVGIRADMDALPIHEENREKPYCSQVSGVMHACGHDAHTAILLGVANGLKQMEKQLSGNVKLFFQPAEETTGGARPMIQAGCLENPHVDYMLGLHVNPSFQSGQVGIKYGKMYAASDMLTLVVEGKSSHGAHPEEGIDAIVVTANILNALQTVVSRNVAPANSAVCTFGTIHGGRIRNQIADRVELEGILRTLDPETRSLAQERIQRICREVAEALGARAELQVKEGYGPLINNDAVTDIVLKNARGLLGEEHVILEEVPEMGVEDFSYFASERPACFFHLGCGPKGMKGKAPDLHNSRFDIDESCLAVGVKLQLENVLALL